MKCNVLLTFLLVFQIKITSAQIKIYVSERAGQEVVSVAQELAQKLKAASGENFDLEKTSSAPLRGFYLKTTPEIVDPKLRTMGREGVYIKATNSLVLIEGNSPEALQHAIYFYLEELGFRFYFPNPLWHIIPKRKSLFIDFELLTEPKFQHRRIWYAHGTNSKFADDNYRKWFRHKLEICR
jgi:hypothetical protein